MILLHGRGLLLVKIAEDETPLKPLRRLSLDGVIPVTRPFIFLRLPDNTRSNRI